MTENTQSVKITVAHANSISRAIGCMIRHVEKLNALPDPYRYWDDTPEQYAVYQEASMREQLLCHHYHKLADLMCLLGHPIWRPDCIDEEGCCEYSLRWSPSDSKMSSQLNRCRTRIVRLRARLRHGKPVDQQLSQLAAAIESLLEAYSMSEPLDVWDYDDDGDQDSTWADEEDDSSEGRASHSTE